MKWNNKTALFHFCGRMLGLLGAWTVFWCATPDNVLAEVRLTTGVERFSWGEYSGGAKLLDESGPRYVLGLRWLGSGQSGLLFGYNGRYYFGDTTYTGQACDASGLCNPFSTATGYQGMLNEALLHYRLDSGIQSDETDRHYFDLVTGLGLDYWVRDIKGKGGVTGYKETYIIGFLRAGVAMVPVKNGMEVAAGLKYPLYLSESAGFKSAGLADDNVALSPKPEISYYGSIGWRFSNPLSVTLDFDSYLFKESDPVSYAIGGVTAGYVHQPESRMEVYTVKVGYSF